MALPYQLLILNFIKYAHLYDVIYQIEGIAWIPALRYIYQVS